MNIIVGIPKIEDFEKVNKLAKQVHEIHVNWRPDLFVSVEEVISREAFQKMIEEKAIYVARDGETILGYSQFSIAEKINPSMRYRKVLTIDAICVDENSRGIGVGTLLLNFFKKLGKENGCTDMSLTVNEENKQAINLYEKFGMRVKNIAYSMQLERKGSEENEVF